MGSQGDARRAARRPMDPRAIAAAVGIVGLLMVVGSVAWIVFGGLTDAERHPAALTVQDMLEVRRSQETTVSAYQRYFESTSVVSELAAAAERERGDKQRALPDWQRPYASAATSREATVVVVWEREGAFADWPVASVFRLRLSEDRWRVADAQTITSGEPPAPLKTR